jgi:hypothetical protein
MTSSTFTITTQTPGGGSYTSPAIPINSNIQCS